MPKFHDLLASVGVAEDGVSLAYPDTFTTDLTAAYDEDLSVYTGKITVLETDLAAALDEIARLKAHNYDLLMQVPTVTANESADDEDNSDEESGEDFDEEKSDLDEIFG